MCDCWELILSKLILKVKWVTIYIWPVWHWHAERLRQFAWQQHQKQKCPICSRVLRYRRIYILNIWDSQYILNAITQQAKMCKYIMQFIILPAVDPGIRYERCKTKTITVWVKDVLYVFAIVLAVSTRGLYRFTYYKDNVLTTYYRRTQIIYIKKLPHIKPNTWKVSFIRYRCSTLSAGKWSFQRLWAYCC